MRTGDKVLIAIGLFAIIIPIAVFFALKKWKTMQMIQKDTEQKEQQRLALEERKRGPSDPGCEKECARNGFCKVNTGVLGRGPVLFGRCCVTNTTGSFQECGAMSDTMVDDDVRKRAMQEYINQIPKM